MIQPNAVMEIARILLNCYPYQKSLPRLTSAIPVPAMEAVPAVGTATLAPPVVCRFPCPAVPTNKFSGIE